MAPLCYRRHRFPSEIIQNAIWLYLRFQVKSPTAIHEIRPESQVRSRLRATGNRIRTVGPP
jgi:transposase-like protein